MNCKRCGSPLGPNDKFCINCGSVVEQGTDVQAPSVTPTPVQNPTPVQTPQQVEQPVAPVQAPVNMNAVPTQNPVPPTPMQNPAQQFAPAPAPAPVVETPKKDSNTTKYIAFIILGIAIIAVAVVVALVVLNKDDSGSGNSNNGGNNVVATVSTYKVTYSGYTFEIPEDYDYEEAYTGLYITGSDWAALFSPVEANYSQLKLNRNYIQSNLTNSGYTAAAPETRTLGGVEFITIEAGYGTDKGLYAYAQLDSTHVLAIALMKEDNTFDYNLLEKLAPIVKSAKAKTGTSNLNTTPALDINVGSNAAVQASNYEEPVIDVVDNASEQTEN